MSAVARPIPNPFRFGALARDESFTDRDVEIAELLSDARNGQDVVIFAPRRFGKTSLVDRVAQRLVGDRVLVGQINLMRTPTKERLAEKLAATVYEDIAGPLTRAKDFGARIFRGLRITPTMTLDPETGALSFGFGAGHLPEDVDATLERLFELVAQVAAERERGALLILDEFQEVIELDPQLPKLLRSVLQEQPEVGHFYLGSKRHMMERIFNDENEPFWRSAKQLELGPIPPGPFGDFIERRFADTGRRIDPTVVAQILTITGGHPYATQELCYFLWEETPTRRAATADAPRRRPRARPALRAHALQPALGPGVGQPEARPPGARPRARAPVRRGLPAATRPARGVLDAEGGRGAGPRRARRPRPRPGVDRRAVSRRMDPGQRPVTGAR